MAKNTKGKIEKMIQEKQLELWPTLPKRPADGSSGIKARHPKNKKPAHPREYLSNEALSKAKQQRGENDDEETI